jgi:hypothetical protein
VALVGEGSLRRGGIRAKSCRPGVVGRRSKRFDRASRSGDDAGDGFSWATAKRSVQAAIDLANVTDEVWLAAGAYRPTTGNGRARSIVMKEGVSINAGFAGNESDFIDRDWSESDTVLSSDLLGNDGEGRPLMRFYRNPAASDLEVEVQVSRDLIDWQILARGNAGEPMETDPIHGLTLSEEPFGEDLSRISVTWNLAGETISGESRQFVRVRARLLPLDQGP